MEGLGPDSAACIRHYKQLARDEDPSKVKRFLAGLIEEKKNKYLLLIVTSGVSRIRNRNRELEILNYLYRSKRLATHLRVYANTRSCYLVCDKVDRDLAKTYIARGYESLHLRLACPPSDRSKWDPTHMGFSVMLAMLNVMMVHGWLGQASFFAESAFADAGNIHEGRITKAFYGTTTRIAKIVGIYYLLCFRQGGSRECAERSLSLLRSVFSHGLMRADGNLVRYLEFSESLDVYRYILEAINGERGIEEIVVDLVNVSILAKPKAKRRVLRKLGYGERLSA
jgi:hypothetical protein